jgi:CheY-like chemotaxis protein
LASPRDTLAGLRILVVEDEMLIAMLIEQMLQELRCEVIGPVSSVGDAIGALRAGAVDGALLDMNLNGESSSPAADELLERKLPFLLVTGYDANDSEPPAFQTASRIRKPFDIEDLKDGMLEVFADRSKAH